MTLYDCIVVGGGVVGSSAAYHLARGGKNVLLLEQFPLPHTRGSSHGPTRLLRSSYDNPLYAHMTKEAQLIWKRLEREGKASIYRQVGFLVTDGPPYTTLENWKSAAQKSSGVCRELQRGDFNQKHRGTMKIPDGFRAYIEEDAGVLRADKALDCLRQQIKHFGGEIVDEARVEHIFPGPIVTVRTNKGEYKANHLIITPGAWVNQLLRPLGLNLPVHVERISVCYFKEKVHGSTQGLPNFFNGPWQIYGLQSSEYDGLMKICNHHGVRIDSPDHRDRTLHSNSDVDRLCEYVGKMFPGLETPPSIIEPCMYTVTPDGGFIVDSLPHHPNIAFGAGFSGHGFKMAPVVGRVLCELAFGEQLSYDISSLRMKRFPKSSVSSNL